MNKGAMRLGVVLGLAALGMGCAVGKEKPGLVKTQVITYPKGALVEYNGQHAGRAPTEVILPQDAEGRLTQPARIIVWPNTDQNLIFAQSRSFDPSNRLDRVPDRIMIDMRFRDTNAPAAPAEGSPIRAEFLATEDSEGTEGRTAKPKRSDRSKPTQPVGMDRWNPGHH